MAAGNPHRRGSIAAIPTRSTLAAVRAPGIKQVSQENATGRPVLLMPNSSNVDKLYLYNMQTGGDVLLENPGGIGEVTSNEHIDQNC